MRSNALITCTVAGIQYLLHPQKLGSIDATIDPDALIPVTLLTTSQIFDGDVDTLLKLYDVYDDVFIPEFGGVLVEKTSANTTNRPLASDVNKQLFRFTNDSAIRSLEGLESGPYFLYGPNLYQAWRLYEDDLDAFVAGIIPEDLSLPQRFRPLTSLNMAGTHKGVGVPSKLMSPPPGVSGPGSPLSGVRLTVSDATSINGVPSTLSSRAWISMHPEMSDKSAQFASKLVSMGAVIIGKTKTSQFTAGRDWIDVASPFSPRGDQYQRPGGCSAGGSTSVSGYDWLDHAIIDDDRGDSLALAAQDGYFSLRPSSAALSTEGTMLASQSFSSIAISARLLDHLLGIAKAIFDRPNTLEKEWTHLIRFVDLEASLDEKEKFLYNEFVQAVENHLGFKSHLVNLTEEWGSQVFDSHSTKSLDEACFLRFCHQFYRGYARFRDGYQRKFRHPPFIEPAIKELWDTGAGVNETELERARNSLKDFQDWFRKRFFPAGQRTAFITPAKTGQVMYRDEPLPHRGGPNNLTKSNRIAALLGLPVLTAPFAQVPFKSRITGNDEYRPVCASVVGPHGSDVALVKLVQQTYHLARWRTRVDTGRLTFPRAKNPRNVDDRNVQLKSRYGLSHHPNYIKRQTKAVSSQRPARASWGPLEL